MAVVKVDVAVEVVVGAAAGGVVEIVDVVEEEGEVVVQTVPSFLSFSKRSKCHFRTYLEGKNK